MTAHEKGTGQKQTISITNDKGRLTKEEIEKMVADAENFAETDKLLKDKIDARHQLENYLYQMRNTVEDKEKLANKIDEDDKYVLNQRVGRLRSKVDYIDYCYLNASLSDEKFISEMHQRSKGAVQKYFNTKDIIEYNVVVPTKHIIDEFNIIYRPIIENRIVLKFQNQKLKEARDILLPRLMNRKIEV